MAESVAQKVTEWLKNNPKNPDGSRTSQHDAKRALKLGNDIKLKIRKGNLTTNRENLRLSQKGKSLDAEIVRKKRIKKSTPKLTEDDKKRKRALKRQVTLGNIEAGLTKDSSKKRALDHKVDSDLTGKQIEDIEAAVKAGKITQKQADEFLEKIYRKRLGDHPDNLQDIPAYGPGSNEEKRQVTRDLQKKLGQMEKDNPSVNERYAYELQEWQKMFERDTIRSNHWRGTDQNIPQELKNAANYINTASQSYNMLRSMKPIAKFAGQVIWGAIKGGAGLVLNPRVY
tara:strand:- start:48 stop:902 length:855 start_codon:yes stop_codon:yes gene_type:complete